MDDIRICGNGHLFPFSAGSCPACDSLGSRPATRAEVEAGEVLMPDPSQPRTPPVAASMPQRGGLGEYLGWGIALIVLGGFISLASADSRSSAGLVVGYVVGVIGFVVALIGVIAIGVREGLAAYAARAGIDPEAFTGGVRPPS